MIIWPRLPLWLEISLALLAAFVISNGIAVMIIRNSAEERLDRFGASFVAQRVATISRNILEAEEPVRSQLFGKLSSPGLQVTDGSSPVTDVHDIRMSELTRLVSQSLPPANRDIRANLLTPDSDVLIPGEGGNVSASVRRAHVSVPGAGGRWLNFRIEYARPRLPRQPLIWSAVSTFVAFLAIAAWISYRVSTPMQRLANAANMIRLGNLGATVPEQGPTAVRNAAHSFNLMAAQLGVTLKSQQALMAAVAHDLRTPLSVLRFRAEAVVEPEHRQRLVDTIEEMQRMIAAVLDAVRPEAAGTPMRRVDITSLAGSLCHDLAETGKDVVFDSNVEATCLCSDSQLRRAIGNLVDNAVRYGQQARVSVAADAQGVCVHIDDDGPGIPEADLERVFEPFSRLENSRSQETGGHGLGLPIARLIARGHGGDVTLSNRPGGGVRATLRLPTS